MNKRQILTAAVLAVGGLGLAAAPVWAQAQTPAADPSAAAQPSQAPAGSTAAQPAAPAAPGAAASDAQPAGSSQGASQSDVRQALSQSANAVLSKDGLKGLSQQLSQRDQQRIGDLSQQNPQLSQTVDQLRQAYHDKYQKDLDLTANADQVFTPEFFRIGGSADQAREASGRIAPDTGAAGSGTGASGSASGSTPAGSSAGATGSIGASGASGSATIGGTSVSGNVGSSGASGTMTPGGSGASGAAGSSGATASGDMAQTASSSSDRHLSVTIPASHSMPDARVHLVREGDSWKINIPDSIDGKQLAQNLQDQLQKCVQSKEQWPADANDAQRAIAHSVFVALSEPAAGARGASDMTAPGAAGSSSGTGTSGGSSGTPGAGSSGSSTGGTSGAPGGGTQ